MLKLIVLDDDHVFRKNICKALVNRGYEIFPAEAGEEALRLVSERRFDAALVDMKMPGMNGFQVIKEMKEIQPSIMGIILTGYGSFSDAVKTIKLGGYYYLTKPCEMEEIEEVLKKVAMASGKYVHGEPDEEVYHGIAGISPAIRNVRRLIQKVKDTALPVLISGESGTGKELVARAIHFDSCRKEFPFIAINCATLKPELLENEFFGHVKGAFTGAVDFKEGLVKLADNGTLFIDEIADMNPGVQASLLRFIETGEFRPLGSGKEIKVNTRCVSAINRDIEDEVKAKRFRQDLYFRLNVCRINIPPLRDRPQDIPVLAGYFLSKFAVHSGRAVSLSPGAKERIAAYKWPGNVRELFHVLQRVLVMLNGEEDTISGRDIDRSLQSRAGAVQQCPEPGGSLDEAEKRSILQSLEAHGWNISRTAAVLGIDRRTLQRKISKYLIRKDMRA